jgi:farnesyl diphosphate synthase
VGADAEAGKATFVTLLGLEAARTRSEQEISAAKAALEPLQGHIRQDGAALAFLSSLADFVLSRRN